MAIIEPFRKLTDTKSITSELYILESSLLLELLLHHLLLYSS